MTARRLTRVADLVSQGLVEPEKEAALARVAERFSVAITPQMVDLLDPADPDDPIARQFLPTEAEFVTTPEERGDPIGDDRCSPVKGIVHRYPDRVLLKPTHLCPVYCRFCFRREQVGPEGQTLTESELEAALSYIRSHPEIWEVILSGGDPLLLSPRRMGRIVQSLDKIDHLGAIRIHSRVPVVDPGRITPGLLKALDTGKALFVVLHANHPQEFSEGARQAIGRLVSAGIPLLSQTVLLRGVNDDAETLTALFRRLVEMRVKPYYLHHGDLARGTSHFRTGIEEGQGLMRALRGAVSGLCQPTYVLDLPGGHGKVPIGPNYLARGKGPGKWRVEDPFGATHDYPPAAPEKGG